jgi:site-specific DNA recombinase
MRSVAYLRVSDPSQVEGHSLDAQERLFYELCKNRGWEPVKVYREEGRSAFVEAIARRPVFRQLLEDAAKEEFDEVVVHTLDRWSRNLRVMLESLAILAKHNVSLVSITENLDRSSPEGRLTGNLLGTVAEFASESLGRHISKALDQRAHEGKHTGGIPFGYQSCWVEESGGRRARCVPEHPGGIHVHDREGPAVTELFRRYASGTTTLSQLASWLNGEGFRTRNTKKLPDPDGHLMAGPRLFTTASVRGILHNPFYTGKVSYKRKLMPGAHQALVGQEVFDLVQATLRKNSGRSETLHPKPEREYLLKGIIRCAYCGMPMWAQTYNSGRSYYREHTGSRGHCTCQAEGASMPCHVPDEQMSKIVGAIELGPKWLEEVLAIISLKDEVERVRDERSKAEEKLRRMAKAYVDNLFPDEEYHRQKRLLEMELESLVVPEANAAEEAGRLIRDLPKLWTGANLEERRKLLLTMLDAVYVDAKEEKRIVAIKPKPPFRPVFQVATTKEGSGVMLLNEPPENTPEARSCFWWRRGRVELPVQRNLPKTCYRLS